MVMANKKELQDAIESSEDLFEAAKKLGISRNTLYYHLKRQNLKAVKRLKLVKNK